MNILPKGPHKFVYWWAIEAPKRIILILSRIVRIVNSNISFTLNIKLLFTPLFGDYSIIGRMVGFIFRVFEIIFGTVIIGVLTICMFIIPVLWFLVPVFLYEFFRFLSKPF